MKRNSTTIYLESPNATTLLPFINNAPDFTGIDEPTLSVLQQAWDDFLASGQALEVVPDPEPIPTPKEPDWTGFNVAVFQDGHWDAWELPQSLKMALIAAAVGRNTEAFQNTWKLAIEVSPPSVEGLQVWRNLAQTYNLPVNL